MVRNKRIFTEIFILFIKDGVTQEIQLNVTNKWVNTFYFQSLSTNFNTYDHYCTIKILKITVILKKKKFYKIGL